MSNYPTRGPGSTHEDDTPEDQAYWEARVSRFTPGPWHINEEHCDVRTNDRGICVIAGFIDMVESRRPESRANARLIASAPDMHAILTRLVSGEATMALKNLAEIIKDANALLKRVEGERDEK